MLRFILSVILSGIVLIPLSYWFLQTEQYPAACLFATIWILLVVGGWSQSEPCPRCGKRFTKREVKRTRVFVHPIRDPGHRAYYDCSNCGADRGTREWEDDPTDSHYS